MRYQDRDWALDPEEREEEVESIVRPRGCPGKRPRTLALGDRPPAAPGSLSPGRRTLTMRVAAIQLKSHGTAAGEIEGLEAVVERTGGGRPLPEAVRRKMERVLGADFSAVRIHEGPAARAMGALAFTLGTDIYFAPGAYDPEGRRGQELLGHELAHVVQQARGRVQPTARLGGVGLNDSSALEREADELGARAAAAPAHARAAPGGVPTAALGTAGVAAIQRQADPAAPELDAVKSKEVEDAEAHERTEWPGVEARATNRKKDIEFYLKTKTTDDERKALTGLLSRWDDTPVVQKGFDAVNGALDEPALRKLIADDLADAAVLKGKRKFADTVVWVQKLATALGSFLDLRRRVAEERTEFDRFDGNFLDADVKKVLATVPGDFRPADLKAMLAQETGDFTDTNIAGLKGKTKGIVNKMKRNPSFVGIGQINNDANKDGRARAMKLGVDLPEQVNKEDARKDPATGIKIAASYLAYIGEKLENGLPKTPARPTGAAMRKLVLAAYNGGPFALIAAVKIVAGKGSYTWESISKNDKAMAKFQKPGEVRQYVRRVTERAP